MATRQNLTFDLGEHWRLLVTCHEDVAGKVVMDLTGATVAFRMARPGMADVAADPGAGTSVADPATSGVVDITIAPQAQSGTVAGVYTYTVRVTKADGTISDQLCGAISVRATEFGSP